MQKVDIINSKILKILSNILPDKTTTNFDLDKAGNKMLGSSYLGTYAIDLIPKRLKKGECFIFNLDKSNQPGSHWMGAYCYKDQHCLIYDSFGRKTNDIAYSVGDYINFVDTQYDPEQDKNETNCGKRCLSFLVLCDTFGYELAKHL